jgi:hypothetical protein
LRDLDLMLPKVGPAEAPWIVGATAGLRALDASGVKGPGDRRKNQANLPDHAAPPPGDGPRLPVVQTHVSLQASKKDV